MAMALKTSAIPALMNRDLLRAMAVLPPIVTAMAFWIMKTIVLVYGEPKTDALHG